MYHQHARVRTGKVVAAIFLVPLMLASLIGLSSAVQAQGLSASCGKDLKKYCSQVTPGDGRIMACLYAHGDKIAEECVSEIQGVALKFSAAVDVIQYGYEQCSQDIEKFCADVEPGQGRMYKCIKKNETALEAKCNSALGLLETHFGASKN